MLRSRPEWGILCAAFLYGARGGGKAYWSSCPHLPQSQWTPRALLNAWTDYLKDTWNPVEGSSFPFGDEGSGMPPAGHRTRSLSLGTLSRRSTQAFQK